MSLIDAAGCQVSSLQHAFRSRASVRAVQKVQNDFQASLSLLMPIVVRGLRPGVLLYSVGFRAWGLGFRV